MWGALLGPALAGVTELIKRRAKVPPEWVPLVNAGIQVGGALLAQRLGGLPGDAGDALVVAGGAGVPSSTAAYQGWKYLKAHVYAAR